MPIKSHAKKYRVRSGKTWVCVQHDSGLSRSTVEKIEQGQTDVVLDRLMQLAYSYGVAPSELFPGLTQAPRKPIRFDHGPNQKARRKANQASLAQEV